VLLVLIRRGSHFRAVVAMTQAVRLFSR
jgi:hypothetical protein